MDIAIYTLGCKVNQYETQAMERELLRRGHTLADFDGPADAYIVNTCTVTAVSDKKCRNIIRRARKSAPDAVVAVCGCYAQTDPEAVAALGVDLVSGSAGRMDFLDRLEKLLQVKGEQVVTIDSALARALPAAPPAGRRSKSLRARALSTVITCASLAWSSSSSRSRKSIRPAEPDTRSAPSAATASGSVWA